MKSTESSHADRQDHPTPLDLKKFLTGKFGERRLKEIQAHVDSCESCCLALESFSKDDALSKAIRQAHFETEEPLIESEARGETFGTLDAPSSTQLRGNNQFGRFELIRELGHGGFGIVWLARDPNLQREVALKIPRTGALISRELKARFLREAWAVAALHHPNVVQVFEAGELDGVCFIASEYCRGDDLAKWLAGYKQPVSPRLAAWIVKEIASAVAHAHMRGVVHRDLKPGNILLEPLEAHQRVTLIEKEFGYTLKVADFGLAKVAQVDQDDTASRLIIGTAAYMAPEQAGGDEVSNSADIYSLGALLYRLLTGRAPHQGETDLETIQLAQNETPRMPATFSSSIPRDLEVICMKSLEIEPRHRYQDASALHIELKRFLNNEPIHARRLSTAERLVRWCRRKPWIAAVWALTFSTAVGAIIFL